MVWWTNYSNNYVKNEDEDYICKEVKKPLGKIFPKMSIMFTFGEPNETRKYTSFDLVSLFEIGVTMFNVDRTIHDEEFFKEIKTMIQEVSNMERTVQCLPVTLCVSMNVNELFEVDDRVDIVILKDVTSKDDIRKFRKEFSDTVPVMMLVTTNQVKDNLKSIIQTCDGVITDLTYLQGIDEFHLELLRVCRKIFKPIFVMEIDIVNDFYRKKVTEFTCQREILIRSKAIVNEKYDGIMIMDDVQAEMPPKKLVKLLIQAVDFMEDEDSEKYYLMRNYQLKAPVLPPIVTALSTSLVATKSCASLIIVLSASGRSSRWVSLASPPCPVIAITTRPRSARIMHMYRNIIPLYYPKTRAATWQGDCRNRVRFGIEFALKIDLCTPGAKYVLLMPSEEGMGYCNEFRILHLGYSLDNLQI